MEPPVPIEDSDSEGAGSWQGAGTSGHLKRSAATANPADSEEIDCITLDSDSDSEQVKYLLEWLFFNNKKSVCRF
jgi:hypothetical protein